MNKVLDWVKKNVIIVVLGVVMIAAAVALPIVSSGMVKSVRDEVQNRLRKTSELKALENTSVSIVSQVPPGQNLSQSVVVNARFLDEYKRLADSQSADAKRIREAAMNMNKKGRSVLLPELFPRPPMEQTETLPIEFNRRLTQAYEKLLKDVRAGMPPSLESMSEDLQKAQARFLDQRLRKNHRSELSSEELTQLTEELSRHRLAKYAEAAQAIGIYASPAELNVPVWDPRSSRSLTELFGWQWQYWVTSDVLMALASANKQATSVIDAPVKRVLMIHLAGARAGSSSGQESPAGTGMGMGSDSPQPPAGAGSAEPAAGAPALVIDPKAEAPTDYAASFTGRKTNPLYDVQYVDVSIVVETARIPDVIDALSSYNFITVLDMAVMPARPYEAIRDGFFYGNELTSVLDIRLETIWFREWTVPFMPSSFLALRNR